MTTSAFQKSGKAATRSLLPGTKPAVQNGQLLVSSGVASLDHLLGGGLAIGTVLMVEEDEHASYSQVLLRYFLGQGAQANHKLVVASADESPSVLLRSLPSPTDGAAAQAHAAAMKALPDRSDRASEDMNIAWRYKHLPKVQSAVASGPTGGRSSFNSTFDLTKRVELQDIVPAPVSIDLSVPVGHEGADRWGWHIPYPAAARLNPRPSAPTYMLRLDSTDGTGAMLALVLVSIVAIRSATMYAYPPRALPTRASFLPRPYGTALRKIEQELLPFRLANLVRRPPLLPLAHGTATWPPVASHAGPFPWPCLPRCRKHRRKPSFVSACTAWALRCGPGKTATLACTWRASSTLCERCCGHLAPSASSPRRFT